MMENRYDCEGVSAEIVEACLAIEVDLNKNNSDMETPLTIASRKGDDKLVKLALEMGDDININEGKTGSNALHLACEHNHENVVKILLNHGADVNATTNKHCQTPLHFAAENANLKISEILLQNGASVNAKDAYDLTALHLVSRNGNHEAIQFFLLNGADIHAFTCNYKNTPILLAAEYGHETAFKLLLENGANINDANCYGYTPLHQSAYRGNNISLLKYIFKLGVDIEVGDKRGRTAFRFACTYPRLNFNVLELFLMEGADANFLFRGDTPMISRFPDEMANILTKYAIKMKAVNLCKTEISLELILLNRQEFLDFHENCKQEILSLKSEGHFSSNITFFHFIAADAIKAGKYLSNSHIYDKLAACNFKENYPIYGDMVQKNFKKGRIRLTMINLSLRYLNFVAKQSIPYLCRFEIISYLSDDDLVNFKLACDPRREVQ